MADPVAIKSEVEDAPEMGTEDDIYEDAGDLEFYDKSLPHDPFGSMYLARVPSYVYEAWNKLDEDTEIQIGTIRQWNERDKHGNVKPKMRLLLRSDMPHHQGVPKEYDLDFNIGGGEGFHSGDIKNTFVFSEQDLPGFRSKNKARSAAAAAGIPAHLLRAKDNRVEKPGQNQGHNGGRRGRQEYFRKAIPKKTAVYGRIKHEMNCTPVKNPESDFILNHRSFEAMKPKATVQFGDAQRSGLRILGTATIAAHEYATDFIKTAPVVTKAKKMEAKTARMPENDLLDLIFTCFNEFRYWSLRSLRNRIPQPEQYLRQTLEKVADLHRSGTFANNWELKPENRKQGSATLAVKASDMIAEGESESDGDDDADMKMEDVL